MNPLVSIIIPVYQAKDYLKECIDSILEQTYDNLEIILIDDGSTDGSAQICDEYLNMDVRIQVIHKRNGGLSDARNAGIEVSNGKYLTFVDSDDIIAPNMISIMVDIAEKEIAEIVKITLIRKNQKDERVPTEEGYEVIRPLEALKRIYKDPPQIISGCGKLFARQLFDNFKFPIGMYYEDEFTTPKLFYNANRIVFSNSIQYFYMQRENNSIMRSPFNEKKCKDSLNVSEDRIKYFKEIGNRSLINAALKDYYYKLENLLDKSIQINDTIMKENLLCKINDFKRNNIHIFIQIKTMKVLSMIKNKIRNK